MAMFNIRREQGRLDELEGTVRGFIERYPALPAWRAALALALVELDRPDEARRELEALLAGGLDALPRDANWLIAITLLAEVCAALGDGVRAGELYVQLEPYAGRNVVVGRGATCNGSASRLLGVLAGTRGALDVAERHFDDALAMHRRMGARPWTARTLLAHAELCLARGAPDDRAGAREKLADALALADELGMVVLARRARALLARTRVAGTRA
jgi:tetratricopeptide (TPR) repeat protein